MPAKCGYDVGDLGEEVSYGGVITPGMPPPKVTIKETVDKNQADCSTGKSPKTIQISLEGELVCCDPIEKMDVAQDLKSKFASPCETFSAGEYTYKGARVVSFAINSSDYRDNVSWSASLEWKDVSSGDDISDKSNVINASEDDDFVTITHTVSAKGSFSGSSDASGCQDCGSDESDCGAGAMDWVRENISADTEPPSPTTITIPNNKGESGADCPDIQEQADPTNCSYSITKTWRIPKKYKPSSNNNGIKHTVCKENSTDADGKETIKISGNLSWEGGSVSDGDEGCSSGGCSDTIKNNISDRINEKISYYKSQYSGRKINVSKNISSGDPPSGSWTVTVLPEADGGSGGLGDSVRDSYSMSVSVSSDGVSTAQINGTVSANTSASSSECKLCEAVDDFFNPNKYQSKIQSFFQSLSSDQPDAMKKLSGPCDSGGGEPADLKLMDSDVDDCDDGSLSFSYSYEKSAGGDNPGGWNMNINETRPVSSSELRATVGGGFCPPSEGDGNKTGGKVTVSGSRQSGPDCDDDGDIGASALDYAQRLSGKEDLSSEEECSVTIDGESDDGNFNATYNYKSGDAQKPAVINAPANSQGQRGDFT